MPGLENTNRAWLNKQNEHDLLCKMNERLMFTPSDQERNCVLYLVTGDQGYWVRSISNLCPMTHFKTSEEYENFSCKGCIARWLNEEHT